MTDRYRHSEWVKFREEVIALDRGTCVRCQRGFFDGVVLQVHHKLYVAGRMPWQYEHSECETLCKGCHAQEHGIVMPQSDWVLLGTDDLGELSGNCECCGTELRYVFAVIHSKWGSMAVGTDCCDRLTMTTQASEYHDNYIKERTARSRFLSSKRWKRRNEDWIIKQRGIVVRVTPSNEKYRLLMDDASGKVEYDTLTDAKLKAYELIESGEAAAYLEQRRQKARETFQRRIRSNFRRGT